MTDSGSNQPQERRRADPLKVAADMLAQSDGDDAPDAADGASGSGDDRRSKRLAQRVARQKAAEKRRAERNAARAFTAARRGRRGEDADVEPALQAAEAAIDEGRAASTLERLVGMTQELAPA